MDLEATAAIAADPDAPMSSRVQALVSVVQEVALEDLLIPDIIETAVDDLAFVDAAVSMKCASSVCAALHQLGPRPQLATTRRRTVRRLVAAGVTGIALAGLAFEIGDLASGVALVVRDYDEQIAPRLHYPGPNAVVVAWLSWLVHQSDIAIANVFRALGGPRLTPTLFAHGTNLPGGERLRHLARSILSS